MRSVAILVFGLHVAIRSVVRVSLLHFTVIYIGDYVVCCTIFWAIFNPSIADDVIPPA